MSNALVPDSELRPSLMAAPREFDQWSRERMLIEQQESTPTEPLYHYTDVTALRSILASQRMWCFSHEQQADKTEFEYALAVAVRVLKKVRGSDDFFTQYFAECVLDMLEVNKLAGPF